MDGKMKIENVLENLCMYDDRNPNSNGEDNDGPCFCDNCFYGRTELAEEILYLIKQLDLLKTEC